MKHPSQCDLPRLFPNHSRKPLEIRGAAGKLKACLSLTAVPEIPTIQSVWILSPHPHPTDGCPVFTMKQLPPTLSDPMRSDQECLVDS